MTRVHSSSASSEASFDNSFMDGDATRQAQTAQTKHFEMTFAAGTTLTKPSFRTRLTPAAFGQVGLLTASLKQCESDEKKAEEVQQAILSAQGYFPANLSGHSADHAYHVIPENADLSQLITEIVFTEDARFKKIDWLIEKGDTGPFPYKIIVNSNYLCRDSKDTQREIADLLVATAFQLFGAAIKSPAYAPLFERYSHKLIEAGFYDWRIAAAQTLISCPVPEKTRKKWIQEFGFNAPQAPSHDHLGAFKAKALKELSTAYEAVFRATENNQAVDADYDAELLAHMANTAGAMTTDMPSLILEAARKSAPAAEISAMEGRWKNLSKKENEEKLFELLNRSIPQEQIKSNYWKTAEAAFALKQHPSDIPFFTWHSSHHVGPQDLDFNVQAWHPESQALFQNPHDLALNQLAIGLTFNTMADSGLGLQESASQDDQKSFLATHDWLSKWMLSLSGTPISEITAASFQFGFPFIYPDDARLLSLAHTQISMGDLQQALPALDAYYATLVRAIDPSTQSASELKAAINRAREFGEAMRQYNLSSYGRLTSIVKKEAKPGFLADLFPYAAMDAATLHKEEVQFDFMQQASELAGLYYQALQTAFQSLENGDWREFTRSLTGARQLLDEFEGQMGTVVENAQTLEDYWVEVKPHQMLYRSYPVHPKNSKEEAGTLKIGFSIIGKIIGALFSEGDTLENLKARVNGMGNAFSSTKTINDIELLLPPDLLSAIEKAAVKYGVDRTKIAAFIVAEQRDQSIEEDWMDELAAELGKNSSIGPGQVNVSTARKLYPELDAADLEDIEDKLEDPEFNVDAVARYLSIKEKELTEFLGRSPTLHELSSRYTASDISAKQWGAIVDQALADVELSGLAGRERQTLGLLRSLAIANNYLEPNGAYIPSDQLLNDSFGRKAYSRERLQIVQMLDSLPIQLDKSYAIQIREQLAGDDQSLPEQFIRLYRLKSDIRDMKKIHSRILQLRAFLEYPAIRSNEDTKREITLALGELEKILSLLTTKQADDKTHDQISERLKQVDGGIMQKVRDLTGTQLYAAGNALMKPVAQELEAAGIRVIGQDELKAQGLTPRQDVFWGWRPLNEIDGLVIHHTATEGNTPQELYEEHTAPGRFDEQGAPFIAYHFLIGSEGEIYWLNALEDKVWHAKDANSRTIGIALAGNHDQNPPTVKQQAALSKLVSALSKRLGIKPEAIQGHGDLTADANHTECPGQFGAALVNSLQNKQRK